MPKEPVSNDLVGITWSGSAFDVDVKVLRGAVEAADEAGFQLRTGVRILDGTGSEVGIVDPKIDSIASLPKATEVDVPRQSIPWDRNSGSFAGSAIVTATSELIGPNGAVRSTTIGSRTVEVL